MKYFLAFFILVVCNFSCTVNAINENQSLTNMHSEELVEPHPTPAQIIGDHRKADGWPIPKAKKKEFENLTKSDATTQNGKAVTVLVHSYTPSIDLFTSEPYETIGATEYGILKVMRIAELSVNKHLYAYFVTLSRTGINSSSGEREAIGNHFSIRYLDSDGDSKFEVVSLGMTSSGVPNWVVE